MSGEFMLGRRSRQNRLCCESSVPLIPRFCTGADTLSAQDVLRGEVLPEGPVLILGGGLVGAECAHFLAEQGRSVTIVELRDAIAADMEYKTRQILLPQLKKCGVRMLTNTEVLELCPGGVVLRTKLGVRRELSGFAAIVVALGYQADISLCADLERAEIPFKRIGDCCHVGKIVDAVWGAFHAAREL